MGMTEDDKRNCCLVEIQETEAKYYKTLEDIEKVSVALWVKTLFPRVGQVLFRLRCVHVLLSRCVCVCVKKHEVNKMCCIHVFRAEH